LQGLAAAPLFIPSAVRGANDRPAFGIVGVGNRGRWLHQTFQKLGAQCVAVCDVYGALVSARPYRVAFPQEEAIAELQRGAGTQFDPSVVQAFITALQQ